MTRHTVAKHYEMVREMLENEKKAIHRHDSCE